MSSNHLVVDGSNIATEGRTLPSLAQLDEAVRAFMAERPHDICTVVVDATFEHRIDKSEKQMYDEALAANELIVTPAGTIGRGDRFILEVAARAGANVLSNDSFQEFHGEYEWLFEKGRLVGGRPVPGVGWVFVDRTPVRGPKSRQSTRDAARKRSGPAKASTRPSKAASEPMPTPKAPPPGKKRAKKAASDAPARQKKAVADAIAAVVGAEHPSEATSPKADGERSGRRRGSAKPQQPLNDQLPFIEFIAEHLPGSTVEGEVVEFSSHGAYVQVGDVRCYIPLRNMGDPAPRSAREVLERGQVRSFVVHSIEAARRGIDLALIDVPSAPEPLPAAAPPAVDKAPSEDGAKQPESEATLAATKKAAGRKTAAKKTAGRKSTAKKSTAKKSTARKATAKRSPAKKATARKSTARKSTAKKSTAKKSTARKSTAKKTTARKSTAKKSTAKKSTAKKSTAKKSTAKKSTAKKSTARKSTAKKAGAKKAGAKKAGAKKAGARKSTAKKSTARKSTAKKAGARKSTAKKSGARKSTAKKGGARKSTARKR
jgi:hypothetical protein